MQRRKAEKLVPYNPKNNGNSISLKDTKQIGMRNEFPIAVGA